MNLPYRPAKVMQDILDLVVKLGNPLDSMTRQTVAEIRQQREQEALLRLAPIPIESVHDELVPAPDRHVPIRIYRPITEPEQNKTLPILIFIHGGGWTLGSVNTYDNITRALASKIPSIVVSVNYRLAPEHPFPAGLEDAFAVTQWVAKNAKVIGGSPDKIALAGDSGGGNIATVAARMAAKTGVHIALQALFYPSTDIASTEYPSYEQYGSGYLLTKEAVERFRDFYLPNQSDWTCPNVSPLRSDSADFALQPPSFILVCGCDPLRDEGIAYAEKLREHGIDVRLHICGDMIHAFLGFFNMKPAASAVIEPILDDICRHIREALVDL